MLDDEDKDKEPITLNRFVWQELERLGRKRPPLYPIDRVGSIDDFLSDTPIDLIVTKWLLSRFILDFWFYNQQLLAE